MKKLIPLLLLVILASFAAAETILDDWVDDLETFNAGDHSFYVEYIDSTQNLLFRMDGSGGIMTMGDCETRSEIKYCFEDVNYPQIKVKITSPEPDITIERTFSDTSPSVNSQITVTVTLKNEGDKRAADVKYSDPYPAALKIFSTNNAGEWEGSIDAGEEESFTYTIRAVDVVTFDSIATVSYESGGEEKTKKSSTQAISVEKPYDISLISAESVGKDELFYYNLTIENLQESSTLKVGNLEIDIPSKISLVKAPSELKKEESKLTFKGAIDKEESKTFVIQFKTTSVGAFSIKTSVALEAAGKTFNEELESPLNVGVSDIWPVLNLTDTINSNSPYDVLIAIKNYGKEEIKDVKIRVESDLFGNLEQTKSIASGAVYEVFKKKLTSPYLEQDKKYNVMVSGSYISSSGRTYSFEKSAQLKVTAQPQIIDIIRELNKEEFYPGEEISTTIKIRNKKSITVNEVDVSDAFPKEVRSSLSGNVTGSLESLGPNEEKALYSYSLKVPEDYAKDEIEFTTTLNAKLEGQLVILKKIGNITVLKGENQNKTQETTSVEGAISNESSQENKTGQMPQQEVKKENFFTKITNWIKNLFKRKK